MDGNKPTTTIKSTLGSTEKLQGICQMRTDLKTVYQNSLNSRQLKLAGFYLRNLLSTSAWAGTGKTTRVGPHPWAEGDEIWWIQLPFLSPRQTVLRHIYKTLQGLINQGLVNQALVPPVAYSRGQLHNTTCVGFLFFSVISHFTSLESFPK